MTHVFQARAELVQVVRVDQLLASLESLRQHQLALGRVSHASGVQAAISLVQRTNKKAGFGAGQGLSVVRAASSSAP